MDGAPLKTLKKIGVFRNAKLEPILNSKNFAN
jgi:hypothetical protein